MPSIYYGVGACKIFMEFVIVKPENEKIILFDRGPGSIDMLLLLFVVFVFF